MIVTGIMAVMTAAAVVQIGTSRPAFRGDGAMRILASQMTTARELAIAQRRYMRLSFTTPNTVQILREEVPGPSTTVVRTTLFEGGMQFGLVSGLPDTPDAFGNSSSTYFGTATNVKFSPDGTLVNQDGAGINGSVFIAIPSTPLSARAITVLGSTGRIRLYKWDGKQWKLA
jgi:hypothetical protein